MKSIIDYTNLLKSFFAQKQALSNEVTTRATLGAHNLVPFPFYEMSKSGYNVSFSVDSNGVVTADTNGQAASGSIALEVHRYQDGNCGMEPNVEYIVSGLDSGASASTYQIYVYSFLGSTHRESKEITSTGDNKIKFTAAFDGIEIYCRVQSGATLNDVKFYPMIRLASDTDPTHQPYAMTNRELTDSITPLLPKTRGKGTEVVTPETGWNCSDIVVERSGNVVHIGGFASYNSDIPSSGSAVPICTLKDTSIAPKVVERVISGCGTDAWKTYQPCYMGIDTSGNIFIELPTGTSADNVNFNLTYII